MKEEVGDWNRYLRGRVLNAGAGNSDISPFVEGEVQNLDLPEGRHNGRLDYAAPLHRIPVPDAYFDAVFCNAVLEHVENPIEVMAEFRRVCRPGGHLYLCVPFLIPEHKDPTDFQRYTIDGLRKLVTDHGFEVVAAEDVFTVHHTLAWIVELWLSSRTCLSHRLLRAVLVPYLRRQVHQSTLRVPAAAPAYRLVGRRSPSGSGAGVNPSPVPPGLRRERSSAPEPPSGGRRPESIRSPGPLGAPPPDPS